MDSPAFQTDLPATISLDDYLLLEADAESKHEYSGGYVWAMAGADPTHNEINYNLNQSIGPHLRRQGCKGYMGDQRVQAKNRSGYLYPDTVTACNPVFDDQRKPRTLTNPVFIAEVLSEATNSRDHTEKFMLYRQIPSLRQHLMLDSQTVHAELYTLDELSRWVLTETRDLTAVLELSGIACQVPLAEVYAGVELSSEVVE